MPVTSAAMTLRLFAILALSAISAPPAQAAPVGRDAETMAGLRLRAYTTAYDLNYDDAIRTLEEGAARWPREPALARSLATMVWLQILFARGSVTVDDYLGPMSRQHVAFEPPPPRLAAAFTAHAQQAIALAEGRLARSPDDLDALYELGAAAGLLASYTATVEGRMFAAFRTARRAYEAHERVLDRDPDRTEAGLTVGTYRYIVANLSWPLRWMARVAGFGGSRDRALRLVENAAAPSSDAQIEAKFALLLLYSRERRFTSALDVIRDLQQRFPRNRLLWLEAGATALRAGRHEEALEHVQHGFAMLARDSRPRFPGEEALWHYKRGAIRVALRQPEDARADLQRVLDSSGRDWVKGRARIEIARLALQRGDRAAARRELLLATTLCDGDHDPLGRAEARTLLAER